MSSTRLKEALRAARGGTDEGCVGDGTAEKLRLLLLLVESGEERERADVEGMA